MLNLTREAAGNRGPYPAYHVVLRAWRRALAVGLGERLAGSWALARVSLMLWLCLI